MGPRQRRWGPGCIHLSASCLTRVFLDHAGERDCSLTAPHPEEAIVSLQKIKASVKTASCAKWGPHFQGKPSLEATFSL